MAETVTPGDDAARAMGVLLRKITGFSGLVHENMYRFIGWRFLVDRPLARARASRWPATLAALADPGAPDGALDLAVEVGDSVMTHRRRYAVATNRETVVDLLALDALNPRSVLYQLDRGRATTSRSCPAPRSTARCRALVARGRCRRTPRSRSRRPRPSTAPRCAALDRRDRGALRAALRHLSALRPCSTTSASTITYAYDRPAVGGRHLLRLMPADLPGAQRRVTGRSTIDARARPSAAAVRRLLRQRRRSRSSSARRTTRSPSASPPGSSASPSRRASTSRPTSPASPREIAGYRGLGPDAPHHFLGAEPAHPARPRRRPPTPARSSRPA